ncbi:hypothetical protein CEXT_244791 [Caerostris extrusa]|uniref:Uncharacterized protein n=1 Tax=Caerostris extrusa TaxID=172846 RepID=A0AAV4TVH5_CAEEX|nr:hypothetical protein CEXT_244791 [Caerostris extrusa]
MLIERTFGCKFQQWEVVENTKPPVCPSKNPSVNEQQTVSSAIQYVGNSGALKDTQDTLFLNAVPEYFNVLQYFKGKAEWIGWRGPC